MRIITIAGKICSGKSFIAGRLSQQLGVHLTSFSQYISRYCIEHNLPQDRKTLQDVGKQLVEADPKKFVESVIENCVRGNEVNRWVIIDGIRHKSIWEIIAILYPGSLLIYIDVPIEIRYDRYLARKREIDADYTLDAFREYSGHSVEAGIEQLMSLADMVITPKNEDSLLTYVQSIG